MRGGTAVSHRFSRLAGARPRMRRGLRRSRDELLFVYARVRCPSASVGPGARVARTARLAAGRASQLTIGKETSINHGAVVSATDGHIRIGERGYIGHYAVLYGGGGLTIGDDALIGPGAVLAAANHRADRVDIPINRQGETRLGIVVENDVWIGGNAVILDGVRVGRGAIVAAGSVVTRDVPPFTLVAGVSAKVIRQRGSAERPEAEPAGGR